jgi:hypothetical protein
MAVAFSVEDLSLLGYESVELVEHDGSGSLYRCTARVGIETQVHHFLYLRTDSTRDELERLGARFGAAPQLHVVTSRSGPSQSSLKTVFKRAAGLHLLDDLLWQRVKSEFGKYTSALLEDIPNETNFVAPRASELDAKERLDDVLRERLATPATSDPRVIVLKAPAGVGKTTLARQLVRQLAKSYERVRVVPVYVESSHWARKITSVDDLWEVIRLSLQQFADDIVLPRTTFERALKRGLVAFVFDGFDELCGNRLFALSAREVFADLQALVADSDAKIVLTTRTQFWEAEVDTSTPREEYSLLPFNAQQAKDYIRKFFASDDAKFEQARSMYSAVAQTGKVPATAGGARVQFWTLPICVSMICEAVRAGFDEEVASGAEPQQIVQSLLVGICDRETRRQSLGVSGRQQLELLKELALLEVDDSGFTNDDLAASGVSELDLRKFTSHPLVRPSHFGRWNLTYEFLAPYLRALAIVDDFDRSGPFRDSVVSAMAAESNGKGALCEHVAQILSDHQGEVDFSSLCARLPATSEAKCFLIHLAAALADDNASVKSNGERTEAVLAPFAASHHPLVLKRIRFTGTFDRLDFTSVEFHHCQFVDVVFKQALQWRDALFNQCVFDGTIEFQPPSSAEALAQATFKGGEFRGDTRVALEKAVLSDSGGREELIKDLIDLGLAKFWHNGKYNGSLRKNFWNRGTIGRSKYSETVLEAFMKVGLISDHVISGVDEGGWLFDRESIQDLRNFMDHRQMSGKVLRAYREIEQGIR